jgi:hypothetical protein
MGDDIIEYKNLYNKIFFTIIENTQPEIFATTNETITDETITDETITDETITDETITDKTIYYKNFINNIKENHPDIYKSTNETITDVIKEIFWAAVAGRAINKKYSTLVISKINSELMAFKNEKQFSHDQLTTFIRDLMMLINDAHVPERTDAEAGVWLEEKWDKDYKEDQVEYKQWAADEARARPIREAEERARVEAEEAKEIKRQARKAEAQEWAKMLRKQDREIEEWRKKSQQQDRERRLQERDQEFETLHRLALQKERSRLEAARKNRDSQSVYRKALLFTRGGSRRRRRKTTRKLRKHYKSHKSSHKYIRRKK